MGIWQGQVYFCKSPTSPCKAQEETIGRLRASAEANERIIAEMAEQLAAIGQAVTETNQAVGDLKDANEDVRAYLASPVPPDLRLLLDR
jgi:predicted metal-binding transcription factor (methanogenesis marker protein 9)